MNEEDSGVIDLRSDDGEADFDVKKVEEEFVNNFVNVEEVAASSSELVKVKFDKFVHLVANHEFEEVVHKHRAEDLIIRADLLTELANISQEKADRKMPWIFIFGILIGLVLAWIFLKT
ncbi:hypothetical protein ACFL21_03660 [Patescibacteria group bacterium]